MVAPTRIEEGCKFYELYASNIPGLFYFNELWESQAHLDAHVATPHFTTIFGKAQDLLAEPLEVNLLTELQ
jgi:quinol monooxygenase YgiN